MKRFVLAIITLGLLGTSTYAQEKKKERTMHVVIKSDKDGKTTKIDTVIDVAKLEAGIQSKIESIDMDSLIEAIGLELAEGWDEVSDELKNIDLDVVINGERVEMDGIEDAMKWVGKLMEDVTVEMSEDDNHIFISSNDMGKKKMRVIVDEDSDSGSILHKEFIDVDLDDDGKGSIIVKSKGDNGDEESVNIWINDDGQVTVNGKDAGHRSVNTRVKVMELEDGDLFFSDADQDDVDVKIIRDKSGNSETRVITKKIIRTSDPDFKNAPALPNGLDLQVYPNPNNGTFQLAFRNENSVKTEVVVYDSKGTEVYRKPLGKLKGELKEMVDLAHLKSGTYILKLQQGKNTNSQQFVIN